MPRLTRAASQQRTRRALIRTARELFLREGYFATSIGAVADAAGYSKGAVYSNFAGKDELCLAVLERLLAERARELAGLMAAAPDFGARLDALEGWADAVLADRGWISLEIEFASQVRARPALREALARRAAALRAALATLIASGAAEAGVPLALAPDDLAAAVLGIGLGLALQRNVDDTVSVKPMVDAIRLIASTGAVTAPSAGPAPA